MKTSKIVLTLIVGAYVSTVCQLAQAKIDADSYIQDGLCAQWDAIDNVGTGTHDPSAKIWKDRVGGIEVNIDGKGSYVDNNRLVLTNTAEFSGLSAAITLNPVTVDTSLMLTEGLAANACRDVWSVKKRCLMQADSRYKNYTSFSLATLETAEFGYLYYYNVYNGTTSPVYSQLTQFHTYSAVFETNKAMTPYYDGVLKTMRQDLKWSDSQSSVGKGSPDGTGKFSGKAAYHSFRFYNRKLTAEEIAYNAAVDRVRFNGKDPNEEFSTKPGYRYNSETDEIEYRVTVNFLSTLGSVAVNSENLTKNLEFWLPYGVTTNLTLVAMPNEGNTFIRWQGTGIDSTSEQEISVAIKSKADYFAVLGNPLPPIFVKGSATGNKDGTSWQNAYTTVASGVAAAIAQGGGEVRIAAGVYVATGQISISGDNSITVKGGYPGIDDNEDDDARNPELYQSIMTADSGTQASTWNHLVPTEDGTFYNATNTTIKIVENGRVNLPEKYHCGLYDTFYPNRANKVTGYAFSADSSAPFELDGVWIVARGYGIFAKPECKSLIVRNCNFVGCDNHMYDTGAPHDGSFPRRFENCKILYSSGQRMRFKGGADFVNCVFRGNMITSGSTTAMYLWAGARTRFVGCEFSRYYRYVPVGADVGGRASNGNIISDEQSSGASFTDCVFSNNLSSSKNFVGITMLSAADIRFKRCCFEKNRTVVNPSSGRTYTGLFLSNVTGGYSEVMECYFADNEVSAPVNNVEGNFNLALIGGSNGDAGMVLNSSFVSNRVFWADNGMSTVYASRGVFTSGGKYGQRAIVNCAFVGPGDDVYDVLQYGNNHEYITRVHNSIFVRTGEKRNPFYFGTPTKFSVRNTSIANFVNIPENLDIQGLEIDEVPLEKIYTNNLPTLRPKARMPSMRTTINVATNTASFLRFKSPTATAWTLYLTSSTIHANNQKLSTETPLPIIDACGEARPFDSFTRGPVQTLSDEAESARTIVIRANPSGAAVFSPSHVQVVQPGGMSAPVSFTPVGNVTFSGWYTNDVLVSAAETLPSFEVTEDVVIEARYSAAPIEITYDLGQCGVFSEGGKSSLTVSAIPNTKFPATPLYTESDDWLFVSWSPNVPEQVPWTNVSFSAIYISKDLRIVHVVPPEEVPEGSDGTGSSWDNAVGDIPEAYRMAGAYRGEVWLKRGTYTPAGAMMPRSNVAIRGGFAGNETSADAADPVANPTIIDGNSTTTDFIYTGQATNCVIEGVTIKRFVNNAIRLTGSSTLYLRNCTIESIAPTTSSDSVNPKPVWVYGGIIAENCIFKANARNIYLSNPSTPTPIATNAFLNCQFINNRFYDLSGNSVTSGSTIFSAGTIPIVISNCVFSGNISRHYNSAPVIRYACDSLVIDSRFEGNEVQVTTRAPIIITGGKHLFIRCSFETNKANTSSAYFYPSVAAVVYQAGGQTMFRDCLFRGNTAPTSTTKAYADNQGSASVLAVNGSYESTFVNCTIEGNSASATESSGSAATILGNNARIAMVNCIVRNNTIGTGAAYSGEFSFGGGTDGSTFSLINSVVQPQSSDKIFMAPSKFRPCVVSSVIEGADLDALTPTNNSYMINASNAEAKFEKRYRIIPPTPPMAVVAPDFAAKHRGVPIWLATDALVYFYDTTPGLAKPWRKVTNKSVALDDAGAAEIGLARDNSPIPDANGAPRRLRKVRLGPVNPRNPGFTIHVR